MPYTTDPDTGAQVPSGTTVPASSRANIRDTLANQEARLDTAETDIDALQAELYTDSDGNIAISSAALEDLTTGTENVCLGVNAGRSITTGVQHICIGPDTLEVCTGGESNIAIGDGAMGFLTSGSRNIAIGDTAGRHAYGGGNLTESNSSIYIGDGARSGGDFGGTNEIVIGHDAEGAGDNTTTIGSSATTDAVIYGKVVLNKPLRLFSLEFGELSSYPASSYPSCILYYSGGTGNKKVIFSDGTDWRYMDGSTV